jgi:hypothetical protein
VLGHPQPQLVVEQEVVAQVEEAGFFSTLRRINTDGWPMMLNCIRSSRPQSAEGLHVDRLSLAVDRHHIAIHQPHLRVLLQQIALPPRIAPGR